MGKQTIDQHTGLIGTREEGEGKGELEEGRAVSYRLLGETALLGRKRVRALALPGESVSCDRPQCGPGELEE